MIVGFFETLVTVEQRYWVRQRLYAHVRVPELFVMELEAQALFNITGELSIPLSRGGCHNTASNECTLDTNGITFNYSTTASAGWVPWTKVYG